MSEQPAVVSIQEVSKQFGDGGVARARGHRPRGRPRRVRLADRPLRLRQVDAAADRRRPDPADERRRRRQRQAGARSARLDRDYGIVFQDAVLYDWRTVATNIALPLEMLGWDRQRRQERDRARCSSWSSCRASRSTIPWQLSGGMQQRVSIARALSFSPRAAADGRAVRRARRDDARAAERRAAADLGRDRARRSSSSPTRSPRRCSSRRASSSCRRGRDGSPGSSTIDLPQPRTHATREQTALRELITRGARGCSRHARDGARRRDGSRRGDAGSSRTARGARRQPASASWAPGRRRLRARDRCSGRGSRGARRRALPAAAALGRSCETLWEERDTLWSAGFFTFKEALGGFVIGCGARDRRRRSCSRACRALGGALMPYAIAANAIPIIAFAPITNDWFGPLEPDRRRWRSPRCSCFFPVLVNTLRGLTAVRPSSIELMRSYAAGEVEIFRRVRIPNSLPYLFSALKVGDRARDDRRGRR